MLVQEHVPIGRKTTMRIGGTARWYAELQTKADIEAAAAFAQDNAVPLILLGGGSNTIFADGEINAFIAKISADTVSIDGNRVTVQCGKILASLLNELAEHNLDLSALTGIPGSVGGAIFGNAGQGAGGIWIGSFVESVTAYIHGSWKTLSQNDCHFRYRESIFKDTTNDERPTTNCPPIIFSVTLNVPCRPCTEVKATIEQLLKKRIETQPHLKTAGSCFKSLPDGTPAWKLIDAAGLRGMNIGDVQIAEKHANFLLNTGAATYADAKALVQTVREKVSARLSVEMRFIENDGSLGL